MATDPSNLDKAESGRTVAVVSTSQIPTGQMVVDTTVHFPELGSTLLNIDRVTRKDTRPLLRGGDPTEIVARLKAEREPAYAEAPIKVMSDTGPHGETVNRILQELAAWL